MAFNPKAVSQHLDNNVNQERLKPVLSFLKEVLSEFAKACEEQFEKPIWGTFTQQMKKIDKIFLENGLIMRSEVRKFCLAARKYVESDLTNKEITCEQLVNNYIFSLGADVIKKYPQDFLFKVGSYWANGSRTACILFPRLIKKLEERGLEIINKKQQEKDDHLQKVLTIFKSFTAHVKKAKEKKENDESVILEKLIQTFTFQSTEKNSLKDVYQDEKVREYLLSACKTFGLENIDHLIDDMCEDEETDISDIAENNYSSYILDCIINLPRKEEEKNAQSIQAMIRTKACRKQFLTYKRTLEKLKKLVPEAEEALRKGKYNETHTKTEEIVQLNDSLKDIEKNLRNGSEKEHKKPRHEYNFNGMYAEDELKSTKEKPTIRKGSL